jgi:hypothetical protein
MQCTHIQEETAITSTVSSQLASGKVHGWSYRQQLLLLVEGGQALFLAL